MTGTTLPEEGDGRHHALWIGRAFLVHLSLDAAPDEGRFCGRVQHVRTSDAAHFGSLDELAAFMCSRLGVSGPRTADGDGLRQRDRRF